MFYIINRDTLAIISGPHDLMATDIKKLLNCGNPDCCEEAMRLGLGIVPEDRAILESWQAYGTPVVSLTKVTVPVGVDREVEVELLRDIDVAADAVRLRLVSPGQWVDQEYLLAHEDAVAYKAAGYTGTVPGGVSTWAAALGWTDQQAADDIIYQKALWKAASDQIRSIRLMGKANVRAAGTAALKWSAGQTAISQLNALFI